MNETDLREEVATTLNSQLACAIAMNAARSLSKLHAQSGVVGIDTILDEPQVQMENLAALRAITGAQKVKMEKKPTYTKYSVVMGGVTFYFLSPKKWALEQIKQ